MQDSLVRARLELVLTALLFSTGGAAIKACTLTAWQVGGLRSAVAALAILALIPRARRLPSRSSLLVGAGYATTMILFVWSNKLTTAASAIFLQYTAPVYMLFIAPWLLKERVVRRDMVCTAAALLGMALLFVGSPAPSAAAPDPMRGNVLAMMAGLTWALTLAGLRWKGRSEEDSGNSMDVVVAGNVMAFLCCLPYIFPLQVSAADAGVLLYLGVFQIGLAYLFLTSALRQVPALEAGLLLLLEPVLNPLWAWLAQGEAMTPVALLGGAIIVATAAVRSLPKGGRVPLRSSGSTLVGETCLPLLDVDDSLGERSPRRSDGAQELPCPPAGTGTP